jgi:nucleoside-diphosphate-sugar epimerase
MLIVTGASGLLGSQILLNAARKGDMSLRGIYRNPKSLETVKTSYIAQGAKDKFESIEWVQADLIDAFETDEAIKGAKYIIHCAAFVSFNSSDADSMLTVNPEISENVWSAAIKNKIIHGVHVSSISTFSYNPNEDYTNEKSETKPGSLSPYGKSKWASELIAWKYQAEGLSLSTVSPSVIIGCPAWENGTSLIPKKIKKGLSFYPSGETGWVDAQDVADFILQIIPERISGEKYILNGHNGSFKEVFKDIALEMNCKPPKWEIPYFLLKTVSLIEAAYSRFTLYEQRLSADTIRASKLKRKYDAGKSLATGFTYRPWRNTIITLAEQAKSISMYTK